MIISFRADDEILRLIEDNREDLSASQFIRRAIRWAMREGINDDE